MSRGHPFYRRFRLGKRIPTEPHTQNILELNEGIDTSTGRSVIIKRWPKISAIDGSDLRSIWRKELRLLQVLSFSMDGAEYLSSLVDAGSDASGYFLAIAIGNRTPLRYVLKQQPAQQAPASPELKVLLWQNLERVVRGIQVLHAHGVVHRRVGVDAIYASAEQSPSYLLTGFDCGFLSSYAEQGSSGVCNTPLPDSGFSFASDWRSFGELTAKLLGVREKHDTSVSSHLTVLERQLLRELEGTGDAVRVHGALVVARIERILGVHRSTIQDASRLRAFVIYDANTQGFIVRRAVKSSDQFEETDTISAIDSDLADCALLEIKQPAPRPNVFALQGRRFTFFLKEHGVDGWLFSRIDRIESKPPYDRYVVRRQRLPRGLLEIQRPFATESEKDRYRGKAIPWNQILGDASVSKYEDEESKRVYDSFVVLHLIEMLFSASQAWPVSLRRVRKVAPGSYEYTAKYSGDENRKALAKSLGLGDHCALLIEMLEKDDGRIAWHASVERSVGSEETDKWTFIDCEPRSRNGPTFHFRGTKQFAAGEMLVLRPPGDGGHGKLMRRRTMLLSTLKEHPELTKLIANPIASTTESHDPVPSYIPNLDPSKNDRLKEICAALPLYLLQGPPGSGKSYLVTELVRQQLSSDRTTRILITSQGHDAVDHLMKEVARTLCESKESTPLVVRTDSPDDRDCPADFQTRAQAALLIRQLRSSRLSESAPTRLIQKLDSLKEKIDSSTEPRVPDKPTESLLLRSANLVFSSTNSAALKLLLDTDSHFDWSIVEEAGRATGMELLAPLMLSHRRLLIGDPEQLPPFGEDKIRSLLEQANQLRKAFKSGESFIQRQLSGLDVGYLLERYATDENIKRLAQNVERVLMLFSHLHRVAHKSRSPLPIAGQLELQYRMHPAIEHMVSKIFYDGELRTSEKTRAERRSQHQPFRFVDAADRLNAPIVVVAMPWMQRQQRGRLHGESRPAYHNQLELEAVLEVLAQIRAKPPSAEKAPSLVVLSPYREQVKRLSRRIATEMKSKLAHLKDFDLRAPVARTVDSFQGDEADIVVASLVRNNGRAYFKGLGILGDARRVNVLLSRAKWTTILIVSMDFLRTRFPPGYPVRKSDQLRFLKDLIRHLAGSNGGKSISVVKFDALAHRKRRR